MPVLLHIITEFCISSLYQLSTFTVEMRSYRILSSDYKRHLDSVIEFNVWLSTHHYWEGKTQRKKKKETIRHETTCLFLFTNSSISHKDWCLWLQHQGEAHQ